MKNTIITLIGFFLPALLVNYAHWDITYITTIGEWDSVDRFFFIFLSLLSALIGLVLSKFNLEELS